MLYYFNIWVIVAPNVSGMHIRQVELDLVIIKRRAIALVTFLTSGAHFVTAHLEHMYVERCVTREKYGNNE